MRSKTLLCITAALITAAVVMLTACLSLLNGSATGEFPLSDESLVPITSDSLTDSENETVIPEVKPEAIPGTDSEIDCDQNHKTDKETNPELDYLPETDTENYPYVGGADVSGRGVVIDIYEQATGKFVGQVVIDSAPINYYICTLFDQNFKPSDVIDECKEPGNESTYLPKSVYRIEVYTGVWFSYSYGIQNNSRWEFTQTGLTCENGNAFIEYIDSLIANEIADIESGRCEVEGIPMSVALKLENGYWDTCERYTPRFPYISE